MVKRTARWRRKRLHQQAKKFGYKLASRLQDSSVYDSGDDLDIPISMSIIDSFENTSDNGVNSDTSTSKRLISATDVACALVLFKQRHRLSISCLNHLLKLLPQIPPSLVPSSWAVVKTLLHANTITSPSRVTYICPTCLSSSSNHEVCSNCKITFDHPSAVKYFHNFNVSDQLHRIFATNHSYLRLRPSFMNRTMTDICDGQFYREMSRSSCDPFITLTMNVDGIQPNRGSNTSIWPITLVLNELPLDRRFSPENVILAGLWPGPSKPSRQNMALFLAPLVDELVLLEKPTDFFLPSTIDAVSGQTIRIRTYLISACCDKPAQALIQNIPEPIAAFGCGRCELPGFMVSTGSKGGFVRSFAADMDTLKNMEQRCNIRYDVLLAFKGHYDKIRAELPRTEQKRQVVLDQQKSVGILGPCVLRRCSMFDVGHSFMADSLHNVYIGAFKRLVKLWLSSEYRTEAWSIHQHIEKLSKLFKNIRLPSTTTRLPRCLAEYHNFKASEYRVLLLFGHVIFVDFLPQKYYDHLLQLVCLIHLAESRSIPSENVDVMQKLGESFVSCFADLYTNRHCVQVVHSVVHIAATVRQFGPLTTYTTFNFEHYLGEYSVTTMSDRGLQYLGLLTGSCKSTRRHAEEMISNIHLLQNAHQHLNDLSIDSSFKKTLLSMIHREESTEKDRIYPSRPSTKSNSLAEALFPEKKLFFFNRLQRNNLVLSTASSTNSTCSDDSAVVFQMAGTARMGRIKSIFNIHGSNNTFLLIDFPTEVKYFTCNIDQNNRFRHGSIQIGDNKDMSTRLVQPSDIIEKCVYYERQDGKCQFMRFPNLVHSS